MKKMFDLAMSSSSSLKLCHMRACMGLNGASLRRAWANGLWEMGQSILNMVQSGVIFMPCTDGPQPSRGFLHLSTQHVNTVYCILLYYTVYFFSRLQVKNKPCEGVTTPAFILRPVSMVVI